jgi:hypothetical protein
MMNLVKIGLGVGLVFGLLPACDYDQRPRLRGQDPSPTVAIAAQEVTIGFFNTPMRERAKVAALRIGRYPVSVARYRACVSAGQCQAPKECGGSARAFLSGSTYDLPHGESLPVTCVDAAQAERYCRWVGGELPNGAEWLAAARGAEVRRFAWGEDEPTCERYPTVNGALAGSQTCCKEGEECSVTTLAAVGAHPEGAAPSGVEDVLTGDGEVVMNDASTTLTDCGHDHCAVIGRNGEISTLAATSNDLVTTFRCVFEESGK